MASRLKRVSDETERAITALAERESRTFVAQLDRVVEAGLVALGERAPDKPAPTGTGTPKRQPAPAGKS